MARVRMHYFSRSAKKNREFLPCHRAPVGQGPSGPGWLAKNAHRVVFCTGWGGDRRTCRSTSSSQLAEVQLDDDAKRKKHAEEMNAPIGHFGGF